MRQGAVSRKTNETDIRVSVNLDGNGQHQIKTHIGFFDHMLEQLSRHSLMDLQIACDGDLHIDQHHSVEDTAIALGVAIKQALGDKRGINRYGHAYVPMDDTLIRCALDFSARPFLVFNVNFTKDKIGDFDTELVKEFFVALSSHAGITLHIDQLHGENNHHIAEGCFKALAKAIRVAVEIDPKMSEAIPSTKGTLEG